MICLTKTSNGYSFHDLEKSYPDIKVNAITEVDYIAFYFTCSEQESFSIALDTIFRATLVENIDQSLFPQESFNLQKLDSQFGKDSAFGGVVFNEMKGVYFERSRQIASATTNIFFGNSPLAYEPGGNPESIRKLRVSDVLAFSNQFITAENCFLLTESLSGFDEIHCLSVEKTRPAYPIEGVAFRQSRFETVYKNFYVPDDAYDRKVYKRYILPIGAQTDSREHFISWLVEIIFNEFRSLFHAVAEQFSSEFIGTLSGIKSYGTKTYLIITIAQDGDGKSLLGEFSAILKHIFSSNANANDATSRLEEREIEFRELVGSYNIHTPAKLFLFIKYILDNCEPRFPLLLKDMEHELLCLRDRDYLSSRLSELTSREVLCEICIRPAPRSRLDVKTSESKLARRMASQNLWVFEAQTQESTKSMERSVTTSTFARRDFSSVQNSPIVTNGISYFHHLVNISDLNEDDLVYVPLLLDIVERYSAEKALIEFGTFTFSHTLRSNRCVLMISFKTKMLARRTEDLTFYVSEIERLMIEIANSLVLCDEDLLGLRKQLTSSVVTLALSQCSPSDATAHRTACSWSGISQIETLDNMLSNTRERAVHEENLKRLLRKIPKLQAVSFLLSDGSQLQTVKQKVKSIVNSTNWKIRIDEGSRSGIAPKAMPNFLISSAASDTVIVMKMAINSIDTITYAAAFLFCEAINELYLSPTFRNRGGAYGTSMGVNFALDEIYVVIYRTPTILERLEQLTLNQFWNHIKDVSDGEFERYRRIAMCRIRQKESSVNNAISELYNIATFEDEKLLSLEATCLDLKKNDALSAMKSYFDSTIPVFSLAGNFSEMERESLLARGNYVEFENDERFIQ